MISGTFLAIVTPSQSYLHCSGPPQAQAFSEAATFRSPLDTHPAPGPTPEEELAYLLSGQKDQQDQKHLGLQKDPVQKEEAKVRGAHSAIFQDGKPS